jgi:hypothetical protein
MVNQFMEPELYQTVEDLRAKLEKATVDIRNVQGLDAPLSVAELMATRRAAHLPVKVRKMWDTLLSLDADEAYIPEPAGHPYAQPYTVVSPLSDKVTYLLRGSIGTNRDSPEYTATVKAMFDAMYDGMRYTDWVQVRIQRRRDAANVGY